jgi:DnaJ-class molecular chaperone
MLHHGHYNDNATKKNVVTSTRHVTSTRYGKILVMGIFMSFVFNNNQRTRASGIRFSTTGTPTGSSPYIFDPYSVLELSPEPFHSMRSHPQPASSKSTGMKQQRRTQPLSSSSSSTPSSSSSSSLSDASALLTPAEQDEWIRKQYRKSCLLYHPDKNVHRSAMEQEQCQERFKQIQQAYELIGTEQARRDYHMNQLQQQQHQQQQQQHQQQPADETSNDGSFHAQYPYDHGGIHRQPKKRFSHPFGFLDRSSFLERFFRDEMTGYHPSSTYTSSNMIGPAIYVQYVGVSLEDMYRGRNTPLEVSLNDAWYARYVAVFRNRRLCALLLFQSIFYAQPIFRFWSNQWLALLVGTYLFHRNVPRPGKSIYRNDDNISFHDMPRVYSVPIQAGYKDGTKVVYYHPNESIQVEFILYEHDAVGSNVSPFRGGGGGGGVGTPETASNTAEYEYDMRNVRGFTSSCRFQRWIGNLFRNGIVHPSSSSFHRTLNFHRYWRMENDLHVRIPVTPQEAGTVINVNSILPNEMPPIPVRVPLAVQRCGSFHAFPSDIKHRRKRNMTLSSPIKSFCARIYQLFTATGTSNNMAMPSSNEDEWVTDFDCISPEWFSATGSSGMYKDEVCVTIYDKGWPIRKTGGYGNLVIHFVVVPAKHRMGNSCVHNKHRGTQRRPFSIFLSSRRSASHSAASMASASSKCKPTRSKLFHAAAYHHNHRRRKRQSFFSSERVGRRRWKRFKHKL